MTKPALAAPLESEIPNAAEYAALGGASVSAVSGSNAMILNPAGVSRASRAGIVLNASPVLLQLQGAVGGPDQSITSKWELAPVGDLAAIYPVSAPLTLGASISVAGGLGGDYGNVSFGNYPISPEVKAVIGALEFSLGAGYEITSKWSVGAAWRITYLQGELRTAQVLPGGELLATEFTDLSGSDFAGFRFGIQFRDEEKRFGVGASVRTSVDWNFEGVASTRTASMSAVSPPSSEVDARLRNVFPLRLAIGGDMMLSERAKLLLQYDFGQYSKNETQVISVGGVSATSRLDWDDTHVFRIGLELFDRDRWPIRLGYAYATQVISNAYPQLFAMAPAPTHAFGLGTGITLSDRMALAAAVAYVASSGQGTPAADSPAFSGEYGAKAITIATSLNFSF